MRFSTLRESVDRMIARHRTIMSGVGTAVRRFGISRRGNIAINFALASIPLLVAAGVAIDLSRALIVHSRLSAALDAAALAVGKAVNLTQQQAEALAQAFFNANYPAGTLGNPGPISVNITEQTVKLSVAATVNTAIMQIVGYDHMDISASTTVTKEMTGLELALVLDTTGSMGSNSKLQTMKNAASGLVNTLFGSSVYPQNLKIGVVPFAEAVRVDTSTFSTDWVDTNGTSSSAQLNFNGGKYAYWLYTNSGGMVDTPWKGCVEARPNGLDETDTPPTIANPDSRFVPMFQPDEPHVGEAENNSWNPAGPNQGGLSSNFSSDYITNSVTVSQKQVAFSTQTFTPMTFTVQSTSTYTLNLSSHGFSTGDGPIKVGTTGTLPTGLTAGTNYWIIRSNSNRIQLATSKANALAGTKVAITSNGSGTFLINVLSASDHLFNDGNGPVRLRSTNTLPTGLSTGTNYWVHVINSDRFQFAASQANATAATPNTINLTAVGSGTHLTNALESTNPTAHGLSTGDGPVTLSGTLPGGLSTGTNYWVYAINSNLFELATSSANATASPPTGVDITSTGSNGKLNVPGVDPAAETLYAPNHGMSSGDGPVRIISTSTLPGGIGANTDYWFIKVDNDTLKLATSRANAIAGTPVVNLTSTGSGTIYSAESPGNGATFETAGGTSLNDQRARQKNWEKYVGKSYSGTSGPYRACAMQPILPITNDKQTILNKISALNASGNTHIPEGLAWGWRLVSPDAPFTEGVSYTNHAFQKAIVLLTDGDNTMPSQNSTLNGSQYTAYGYAKQDTMGAGIDTVNEMETEMGMGTGSNKVSRICTAIKALNIRLYTIAVQINNSNTRDMLQQCATTVNGQQLYFNATDNTALTDAFTAIATDLSNLRISQ